MVDKLGNINKREWALLSKVFAAEIEGRHVLQSKARGYANLETLGLVVRSTVTLGRDRFGAIEVSGWALTPRGHILYCEACQWYATEEVAPPRAAPARRKGRK